MTSGFSQATTLLRQYLTIEITNKERLLTSLLFAASVLLCFTFAFGKIDRTLAPGLFLGEAFVGGFLALQIYLGRITDIESQNKVFEVLRTMPLKGEAWFCAKYFYVVIMSCLTLIPTILMAALFLADRQRSFLDLGVMAIAVFAVLGSSAIGVLLSLMTMGTKQRQVLFPILYFPLVSPIIIAAVEGSRAILVDSVPINQLWGSWLGLLGVTDTIYCCLGYLLYGMLAHGEA